MRKGGLRQGKLNNRPNLMLRLAAVLAVLAAASFWCLSGLLARYAENTESGDRARVASFDVSAQGSADSLTYDCTRADSSTYVITANNGSEVAVAYDVRLTLDSPLPSGVVVKLDGKEPTVSDEGKTLLFSSAGELAAGTNTEAKLTFIADKDVFGALGSDLKYEQTLDFAVTVSFVQID